MPVEAAVVVIAVVLVLAVMAAVVMDTQLELITLLQMMVPQILVVEAVAELVLVPTVVQAL